jgi:acetyl-CoA carboxylase alpha subunit
MGEQDSDFSDDQKVALQRLAALQRMREDARRNNRPAMLDSIQKLIEMQTKLLRGSRNERSG